MNALDEVRAYRARQVAAAAAAADPFMKPLEVAAALRVSKETVYRAIRGNTLQSIPVGRSFRIRRSWFEAWVRDGAPTPSKAER